MNTPNINADIKHLPVSRIRRNPNIDPRKGRNKDRYESFVASIRAQGVLQPILVRPVTDDADIDYEVVAGNTRWQGATDAQLEFIPAIIREMSDEEAKIAAAVENIQRADLTPVEEAHAASALLVQTGNDHDEVMRLLGWSRTKLNSRVLLTQASDAVAQALLQGQIKLGHAELLCPLEHADQDMILSKIVESGMGVTEARDRLMKLTRRLENAAFDTAGCTGCAHNSSTYSDLFDTSVGAGQCQNLTCWESKVQGHLDKAIAEAKDEFGLVYRSDEVPAGGYQIIATDGAKGVGVEQAAACRSCASYGAVISARNGEEGKVAGRFCFNVACHGEKVSDYQATVKAALEAAQVQTPASASAAARTSDSADAKAGSTTTTAVTDIASKKPKADGKPRSLRTGLRRVAHGVNVELASRHIQSSPAYGYALAVQSLYSDLNKDVPSEKLNAVLAAAGVSEPGYGKERQTWAADLVQLGVEKLLALIVQLSALATLRNVVNDDFEHNNGAVLAGIIIERESLNPADVFVVSPTYLDVLTKEEMIADCVGAGFDSAYDAKHGEGSFKKLANGKVKELREAMHKLEGFDWKGYLPAFIKKPVEKKAADASGTVAAA